MNTVIQMHIDELDEKFIQSLKILFKEKRVTIQISDSLEEMDYLFSNEANRNHLLTSLEQVNENKIIQFKTIAEIEKTIYESKAN
jgi:predicted P-loop ATPase/GTPase